MTTLELFETLILDIPANIIAETIEEFGFMDGGAFDALLSLAED